MAPFCLTAAGTTIQATGIEIAFQKIVNIQPATMLLRLVLFARPCAQSSRHNHGSVGCSTCSLSLRCASFPPHNAANINPNPTPANTNPKANKNQNGVFPGAVFAVRIACTITNNPPVANGSANKHITAWPSLPEGLIHPLCLLSAYSVRGGRWSDEGNRTDYPQNTKGRAVT